MKKKYRSFLGLVLTGVVIFLLLQWWQDWRLKQTLNALQEVIQSDDLTTLLDTDPDDGQSVDQAMRGIHMIQGKQGREVWQLRAEWGTYHEESGFVEMQSPDAKYAMGSADADETTAVPTDDAPASYVTARSQKGTVEGGDLIIMDGDVFAEFEAQTLEGPYATFRTEERILELPRGGLFSGRDVEGEAEILRWDMTTNIIEAENGVKVVYTPSPNA